MRLLFESYPEAAPPVECTDASQSIVWCIYAIDKSQCLGSSSLQFINVKTYHENKRKGRQASKQASKQASRQAGRHPERGKLSIVGTPNLDTGKIVVVEVVVVVIVVDLAWSKKTVESIEGS
ncbi:hypothetical protein M0802_009427 [Mischocyttarus mexicanus]|nr:hypothetical protein M0802_009427 [Mischocyttarus mexicanus]